MPDPPGDPVERTELTISQLASVVGITPRTIRFYEAEGLLRPRRIGTIRVYDQADHHRLLLILRGKRLGFSVAMIRDWLELYAAGEGRAGPSRPLLERARHRIAELEARRGDLDLTLDELREIERRVALGLAREGGGPAPAQMAGPDARPT